MKTKHKDIFFELSAEIAEGFLNNSEEIRASGLKTTSKGQPYVFIKADYLQEAIELVQLLWERKSLEALEKKQVYA